MSRSYRADVHCSVYLVNNSKHGKSTEKADNPLNRPVSNGPLPSPWFEAKSNDMSVTKAVKDADDYEEPRRRRLAKCAVRPQRTGETCLGEYGCDWEPPEVPCSVDGERII